MIALENQTDLNINLNSLEMIAKSLSHRPIELIIMDEESIQSINHRYRGKNQSTDVLSFPLQALDNTQTHIPLGSILICDAFIKKYATYFKHSQEDELCLLFIHGLLHLLGFDHEDDQGEMREKEKEIIQKFGLSKSLIIRTEEY